MPSKHNPITLAYKTASAKMRTFLEDPTDTISRGHAALGMSIAQSFRPPKPSRKRLKKLK